MVVDDIFVVKVVKVLGSESALLQNDGEFWIIFLFFLLIRVYGLGFGLK